MNLEQNYGSDSINQTKHTEQETFDRLRRTPYAELVTLYNDWEYGPGRGDIKDTSQRIPFMKNHGWTWYDFVMETKRRRDSGIPGFPI